MVASTKSPCINSGVERYGDDQVEDFNPILIKETPMRTEFKFGCCWNVKMPSHHRAAVVHWKVAMDNDDADVLENMPDCIHCNAVKFKHETGNFCCSKGEADTKLPSTLMDLLTDQTKEAIDFRSSIRTYNNHLAFTSLGVTYDKDLARRNKGLMFEGIFFSS